jgi:hypothetical protein
MSVSNVQQNGVLDGASGNGYLSNPVLAKYFMSPWLSPYNADGSPNLDITTPHNVLYTVSHDIRRNDLTRVINNTSINYELLFLFLYRLSYKKNRDFLSIIWDSKYVNNFL